MTEYDIQKKLFDAFLTLNSVSGHSYLDYDSTSAETDEYRKYKNVHFPNYPFEVPQHKTWFDLTFRNNEPVDAALMEDTQNRFTGVLYIDIMTQQDVGELESEYKYKSICKLFNEINIDVIDIMKVYISNKGNDADYYKLQVAVEWEADIDKE